MKQDTTVQDSALATILVVDDEELIRQYLCAVLTFDGYRTLAANDGVAALGIYKRQFREIDLVLSDIVMPGMCGTEMLGLMHIINPGLKAAIISGYFESADLTDVPLDNVVGVLRKPFSTNQLRYLLHKALPRRPLAPQFLAEEAEAGQVQGAPTKYAY